MLVAELRRKLMDLEDIDPESDDALEQIRALLRETKEDLLTADVFGVLKYLPRDFYLDAVLAAIGDRNPTSTPYREHLPVLRASAASLKFRFWPNYATPEGLPGSRTEPDVEIGDGRSLILVEAKLNSGFGDQQVERELAVALEEGGERQVFVLLVTASSLPPHFRCGSDRLPFADYMQWLADTGELPPELAANLAAHSDRVLWLSWDVILNALTKARNDHQQSAGPQSAAFHRASDLLDDLTGVMLLREIQPFRGLTHTAGMGLPFSNRRPVLIRLQEEKAKAFSLSRVAEKWPIAYGWKWGFSKRKPGKSHQQKSRVVGTCCLNREEVNSTPFRLFRGGH